MAGTDLAQVTRETRPKAPGQEDADLVAALRAGDAEAFRHLVREIHPTMVQLAATWLGDRQTAEEVAQETWLAVLRGLPTFRAQSSVRTWVLAILIRRARSAVRELRQRRALCDPLDEDAPRRGDAAALDPEALGRVPRESHPRPDRDPEGRVLQREALRALWSGISRLPTAQRVVVVLRDIEGHSSRDVRHLLKLTAANERVLLHRARVRLRAALAPLQGWSTRRS